MELAIKRVETRVIEGGHNIPENVIRRRYKKGLENFFGIFKPIVHSWILVDNSERSLQIIAERKNSHQEVMNQEIWGYLKRKYHG